MKKIPTTVVTGSLGAGKTTVILNLVKQFPKDYKTLWLKNEYGDLNIDSELANGTNIQTKEIMNGCLCCVLIGKLKDALEEISKNYILDRLIIETAGTAYPYPIVNEVNDIEKLRLDGLVCVVDALNFKRFKDKSIMARAQAKYVDLVVINKVGLVTKDELNVVEDEVYDLYPETQKIFTKDGKVSKEILIGIDSKLIENNDLEMIHDEHGHVHHEDEVEVFGFEFDRLVDKNQIEEILLSLKQDDFYRIKGIINTIEGPKLLNYVLGRITWDNIENYSGKNKLVFMGKGISFFEKELKEKISI